jgi:hypothetical protein
VSDGTDTVAVVVDNSGSLSTPSARHVISRLMKELAGSTTVRLDEVLLWQQELRPIPHEGGDEDPIDSWPAGDGRASWAALAGWLSAEQDRNVVVITDACLSGEEELEQVRAASHAARSRRGRCDVVLVGVAADGDVATFLQHPVRQPWDAARLHELVSELAKT